jgi:DNA segregation ATPase FtsK/SpoIIIE, S-DNA-T family
VLRQTDENTYRSFGVPGAIVQGLTLEPGQALSRHNDLIQVAAVRDAVSGETGAHAIRTLARGIRGQVAQGCSTAALPDHVDLRTALAGAEPCEATEVLIGLADLTLQPVSIDLSSTNLAVIGPPRSGRSTALVTVASQFADRGTEVWAVGPAGSPLEGHRWSGGSRFGKAADVAALLGELATSVEQFPGVARVLVVDDIDRFDDGALNAPLKSILDGGVRCLGAATSTRILSAANPLQKDLKNARSMLVLAADDDGAIQAAVGSRFALRPGLQMPAGRAVLVHQGIATVIQVADHASTNDSQPSTTPASAMAST